MDTNTHCNLKGGRGSGLTDSMRVPERAAYHSVESDAIRTMSTPISAMISLSLDAGELGQTSGRVI